MGTIKIMVGNTKHEEYESQTKYADLLFLALDIPIWRFIMRFKAFLKAERYRDSHKKCCEWANEEE